MAYLVQVERLEDDTFRFKMPDYNVIIEAEELSDVSTPEKKPILEGKNMFMLLAPKKQ
mgnify:CR=1 FL=1